MRSTHVIKGRIPLYIKKDINIMSTLKILISMFTIDLYKMVT